MLRLLLLSALVSASSVPAYSEATPSEMPVKITELGEIWSANTVNFALKTVGQRQFAAYYNAERMMTVAMRDLNSSEWIKKSLPVRLHWDSHNSVTLGIDPAGYIHLSGNMHADPLIYFRSERPYDISSFIELNRMVGTEEDPVTYPIFFQNKAGDLLYSYRVGSSGNGNILINRFLPESLTWERYVETPLFAGVNGDETRSAYHQFTYDDDGNLHFAWIWRWTPLVETSHNICYVTTPDLINWTNAAGEKVSPPFSPDDPKLFVDPVPTKGGTHNGRVKLIIDDDGQPIVGYVKYDEEGMTQLYLARFENGAWMRKQISDWDFRWKFVGGGDKMTIGGKFTLAGISPEGFLVVDWETEKGDSGQYVVDSKTFEHSDRAHTLPPPLPPGARDRITDIPNLNVSIQTDSGRADNGRRYFLKWEAARRTHSYHGSGEEPDGPVTKLYLIEY